MEKNRSTNTPGISGSITNSLSQADQKGIVPDLSICIVSYQAKNFLRECLQSIYKYTGHSLEIIVVDNGSQDGTQDLLRQEFPDVQLVENKTNLGYTFPMNRALRLSRGKYLLQLNPDTLVFPQSIDFLFEYMEENPKVGICGPKVLNQDGSLQKPCRRGESRPWAVFSYFSGLARLFPKNRFFCEYLLTYLDEDQVSPVAGVSGSCMLIRRAVVDQIGYLDEKYFAYQEDADYCFRARQSGWQVVYYPKARITHYGGMGGTRVQPFRSIYHWHRSYYLYYHKNLAKDYCFLFNWFYSFLMLIKLSLALITALFHRN